MMKRFILILIGNIFTFSIVIATEQCPDILIIGKDTIYLKSFPLENLKVNNKTFKAPFDNGGWVSTGCWRGYIATWQIIDELLVLTKVENHFSKQKLNIVEYFKRIGYNPKTKNGYVIADWYTDSLKNYESVYNEAKYEKFYLIGADFPEREDKKVELKFVNGKLIRNSITPIENYKVGGKVSFYYSQNWILGFRGVTIHGVIRENNGKMVRLEDISFSADNEETIKQIQQKTISDFDNFWINPRYCIKEE